MPEHMKCERCGVLCEKTGRAQKYCPGCRREKEREWAQNAKRGKRKADEGWHKGELASDTPHKEGKSKSTYGTGCKRWKSCKFGAVSERGGVCDYNYITGHCKVILKDGRKIVAPTKDCVFYQKKETGKDSRRK